ncbi:hypothetical protein GCM10010403_38510 [Glycomyces rutgersensis]|uniref:Uncharacterized protein n=1 Tax=Glycomyces rutgersensis TaxID=58115 RepID=A0ABN3G0S9_9ACTN
MRGARTARTNVPTPGRLSTSPRALSACIAFCTVTGLAPYSAISSRFVGTFAPAGAAAIHARRPSTIR